MKYYYAGMRVRPALAVAVFAGLSVLLLPPSRAQLTAPPVSIPGEGGSAPSDAVALFAGADVSGWKRADGSPTGCRAEENVMVCESGAGNAFSVETFQDAQIHVEFNVPHMPDQQGQLRGNSGVYLHCYELQVLDSWDNPTYPDGSCGALYGIAPPLVNASRRPGEWQSYDVLFRAPRCNEEGKIAESGRVTAFHNGVLIHDNVAIPGPLEGCGCAPGPLMLQDHGGFENAPHTVMKFRNIWLRRLPAQPAQKP